VGIDLMAQSEATRWPVRRGGHFLVRDGRAVVPVGAHIVPPQGPDWPWRVGPEAFDHAFAEMARFGLNAARFDVLWEAVEPTPGRYDENHLRALDEIFAAARRRGIWLHPALFVGGEVGDAVWDVPWRAGRNPHADAGLVEQQAAHVRMLASRWRADPALLGWDLTDEPPWWLFPATTDEEARTWTAALVGAIREVDSHPITIGVAGQESSWGPFRADVVAGYLDVGCVHPYPIYQPRLYPDKLLAPRMTLAGAFETALASGAGIPVMLHEYGASSAQFDPELIAAYDRLLSWASLGRGAIGFLAWCWTDAEPAAFARAPYVRQPHETQFGVTDHEGRLRPRGRVLADLAATVRALDVDGLASSGPDAAAVAIPVPHEYARPYDSAAYGLDDAPSGRYVPAERSWQPDRDVTPLVLAWENAFVLAARAGLAAAFPRERLDGTWPQAPVVALPAPLASTSNTLLHVRTSFWSGARPFLAGGGVLYVSCSADVAIPGMDLLAGCRIADRAAADRPAVLRFVTRWGPFRRGDELELPGDDGTLATRGVRLALAGAEVVAVDAEGSPALAVAVRGPGRAVTCAYPIELLLASVPDAHGPGDRAWGLYAGIAELASAGIADRPRGDHPDVTVGSLRGPRGGAAVLTNHGPTDARVTLRLPGGAHAPCLVGPGMQTPCELDGGQTQVVLESCGAAILAWEAAGAEAALSP
jgi:beta-galactosidase